MPPAGQGDSGSVVAVHAFARLAKGGGFHFQSRPWPASAQLSLILTGLFPALSLLSCRLLDLRGVGLVPFIPVAISDFG